MLALGLELWIRCYKLIAFQDQTNPKGISMPVPALSPISSAAGQFAFSMHVHMYASAAASGSV